MIRFRGRKRARPRAGQSSDPGARGSPRTRGRAELRAGSPAPRAWDPYRSPTCRYSLIYVYLLSQARDRYYHRTYLTAW